MRNSHSLLLRAMIAAVLIAAFIAGGCTKYDGISDYERVQLNQKQGVDAIVAQGGKAEKKNYGLGEAWIINLSGKSISNETISNLKAVDKIAELHLSRSSITDEQIVAMRNQKTLNVLVLLDVSHTQATDAILDKLGEVQFLGELNVTGTRITAAGLERFKQARQQHPNNGNMIKTRIIGP